jgi:hypothetical protein
MGDLDVKHLKIEPSLKLFTERPYAAWRIVARSFGTSEAGSVAIHVIGENVVVVLALAGQ